MLIRKILIIGACNAQMVFSKFTPEDISVIGKEEDLDWLRRAPGVDFAKQMSEVKAAVVLYDDAGKQIFERLIRRAVPTILILPFASRGKNRVKFSFIQKLIEEGAKGIFLSESVDNPLAVQELYRQVENLVKS